jgi:prophage regulatory protein
MTVRPCPLSEPSADPPSEDATSRAPARTAEPVAFLGTPRVLRRRAVEATTGLSRSTIYARIGVGAFPKPIRLGGRSVGWIADEIESWIAARIAESRPEG